MPDWNMTWKIIWICHFNLSNKKKNVLRSYEINIREDVKGAVSHALGGGG